MTTLYALAADILASGLSYGFAMPTSVPADLWCEARMLNVDLGDEDVYLQLFDADGKVLTVALDAGQVRETAGGEVGTFPGVGT